MTGVRVDAREVVAAKRDGRELSGREIGGLVLGYARGDVPDYLAASFLMAAFLNGLSDRETADLTRAMIESGETLPLSGIARQKVDKHSTGGVSDGVTLVFAPLAAALGLAVAKLSGRGLGHTGGTLDKLESIPGFRTDLSPVEFERQVQDVGCAVAGQSKDLVPADGALYELRDATATVASIPLIAASVMSKKLAVGTDLILLDVKAGSGAFMKTVEDAGNLAAACMQLAAGWGRQARAAVTDMSQPLGEAVGNALDIAEAVRILRGEQTGRLTELALVFAAAALVALEGVREEEGRTRAEEALASGRGAETFARMVQAQGGDPRIVEDPWAVLPRASTLTPIASDRSGWLTAVDAEAVGRAAIGLGAGRRAKGDPIDPAVGLTLRAKVGDRVDAGEEIGEVHARDEEAASRATAEVLAAMSISDEAAEPPPLVHGWRDA
jgi:pyrimidine-nucleoside phosphorylase